VIVRDAPVKTPPEEGREFSLAAWNDRERTYA
jgi:hypothetical protein